MAAATVRSLYPLRVRQRDLITVLSGIARFVRTEGYWPKAKELSSLLRADHGATVDCLHELSSRHLLDHLPSQSGAATYRLRGDGWQFLGLQPIEPWRKRPSKALIRQAIDATSRRIMRMRLEEQGEAS